MPETQRKAIKLLQQMHRQTPGYSYLSDVIDEHAEQYGTLYDRWLAWEVDWSTLSPADRNAIDVLAHHLTLYLDPRRLT